MLIFRVPVRLFVFMWRSAGGTVGPVSSKVFNWYKPRVCTHWPHENTMKNRWFVNQKGTKIPSWTVQPCYLDSYRSFPSRPGGDVTRSLPNFLGNPCIGLVHCPQVVDSPPFTGGLSSYPGWSNKQTHNKTYNIRWFNIPIHVHINSELVYDIPSGYLT